MFNSTKKLFLVPVGLPGMGKSTLAKNFRKAIETHNLSMQQTSQIQENLTGQSMGDYMKEAKLNFATEQLITSVAKPYLPKRVIFQKVSYDRILGNKVKEFSATNPTVPFHEVIDIIRPKADR